MIGKKILVVDDEKIILKGIRYALEQDKYIVDTAMDGEQVFFLLNSNNYDLIILDLMLPKINGIDVLKKIRGYSFVPVIMLTARDDDLSKVTGLEIGADDYITKPFSMQELKARIKSLIRRSLNTITNPTNTLQFGEFEIIMSSRKFFINGERISLSSKEFDLMYFFMLNRGRICEREELLKILQNDSQTQATRNVDVHIRKLREKIEKYPSKPKYLKTKWGSGYILEV